MAHPLGKILDPPLLSCNIIQQWLCKLQKEGQSHNIEWNDDGFLLILKIHCYYFYSILLKILLTIFVFVLRNITLSVSDQLLCRLMSMKMPLWSFLFSSSYNLIALNTERYISIIAPIYHKTQVRIIRSCHNRDVKNAQSRLKISKSARHFLASKDLNIS